MLQPHLLNSSLTINIRQTTGTLLLALSQTAIIYLLSKFSRTSVKPFRCRTLCKGFLEKNINFEFKETCKIFCLITRNLHNSPFLDHQL